MAIMLFHRIQCSTVHVRAFFTFMSVCIMNYDIRILSALKKARLFLYAFCPHLSEDKMRTETTDIKVKKCPCVEVLNFLEGLRALWLRFLPSVILGFSEGYIFWIFVILPSIFAYKQVQDRVWIGVGGSAKIDRRMTKNRYFCRDHEAITYTCLNSFS